MNLTKRASLVAGAAALSLTGTAFGGTTSDANDKRLQDRVAELEAKLAEMEARQGQDWMSEQRAAEIRSLVQDVLMDADTRASLLQGGMTGGYDEGFFLGDAAGDFRLNIGVLEQFRWVYSTRDDFDLDADLSELDFDVDELEDDAFDADLDAAVDALGIVQAFGFGDPSDETVAELLANEGVILTGDNNRSGFENARTRLIFWGNLFGDAWEYKVSGNFDNLGGELELYDAWIAYNFGGDGGPFGLGEGWTFKAGQFKAPLLREELVHASMLQAVERSLWNEVFTADRTQGLMLEGETEAWRAWVSYNDGYRADNSPALAYGTEYAFTGRMEFLFSGEWDQFNDFVSWQDSDPGFILGAAGHIQESEYGTDLDNETQVITLTADASAEFGGANLFGALVYTDFDNDADAFEEFNPWGFLLQGGYLFAEDWEVFGRFEWADADAEGVDDMSIATAGVTKYFVGHNSKWTTDVSYAFNEVSPFWLILADQPSLTGWRPDTDEGQIVVRSQWQLLF